jgi:hypothetical protein
LKNEQGMDPVYLKTCVSYSVIVKTSKKK